MRKILFEFLIIMFVTFAFLHTRVLAADAPEAAPVTDEISFKGDTLVLRSEHASSEEISSFSLSLMIEPKVQVDKDSLVVNFSFDDEIKYLDGDSSKPNAKAYRYTYNKDNGRLNLYIVGAKKLFSHTDYELHIGKVAVVTVEDKASDEEGTDSVPVYAEVTVVKDSLKYAYPGEARTVTLAETPRLTINAPAGVDADKAKLNETIAKAEGLTAGDYTEESYKKLEEALAAAQEIAGKADASQDEIDAVLGALSAAIDGLESAGGNPEESSTGSEEESSTGNAEESSGGDAQESSGSSAQESSSDGAAEVPGDEDGTTADAGDGSTTTAADGEDAGTTAGNDGTTAGNGATTAGSGAAAGTTVANGKANEASADTGDESPVASVALVLAVSGLIAGAILITNRRKRR